MYNILGDTFSDVLILVLDDLSKPFRKKKKPFQTTSHLYDF